MKVQAGGAAVQMERSAFEDLIGLIEQFTNRAASHPARREILQGDVQNGRCLQAGGWGKEAIRGKK